MRVALISLLAAMGVLVLACFAVMAVHTIGAALALPVLASLILLTPFGLDGNIAIVLATSVLPTGGRPTSRMSWATTRCKMFRRTAGGE
jgi:hypothetical protein